MTHVFHGPAARRRIHALLSALVLCVAAAASWWHAPLHDHAPAQALHEGGSCPTSHLHVEAPAEADCQLCRLGLTVLRPLDAPRLVGAQARRDAGPLPAFDATVAPPALDGCSPRGPPQA